MEQTRAKEPVLSLQQPLMRTAFLLTAGGGGAQDLVQDVLVKILVAPRRALPADDPTAYARRMLVNTFLAGRRRAAARELVTATVPERPAPADDAMLDRQVLRQALTAELLGCSVGTVRSLTSRGLATLRTHLEREPR